MKKRTGVKKLNQMTPQGWYYESIRKDPFQKFWHQRRFYEIGKIIEPKGGKVLDVGCADGVFSKIILDKSKAEKLIGIDIDKNSIDWANKHWGKVKQMNFYICNAEKIDFKNNFFDTVFALEVMEHVSKPEKVLKELKRILKRKGCTILLVPTDSLLFRFVWFLWLNFYPRGYFWRETHIQTYRNNYLPKLCKRIGFKVEIDKKFNLGMLQVLKVRKI